MAEEFNSSAAATATATTRTKKSLWPSVLRWIPSSTDHIIDAEKRLLSIVKTPYTQEHVNIGTGPPGSKPPSNECPVRSITPHTLWAGPVL
ncbi:hypothetical protein QVD17_10546 [Tagetes erecta]|uniref:Uncharacterized protein n=1 Tax=Tagetes erecta TaxID=13708 RepID=A0AAD8L856_TARER|nr:hypothetical protein QVD17_10546 [Tagetes erecta]